MWGVSTLHVVRDPHVTASGPPVNAAPPYSRLPVCRPYNAVTTTSEQSTCHGPAQFQPELFKSRGTPITVHAEKRSSFEDAPSEFRVMRVTLLPMF